MNPSLFEITSRQLLEKFGVGNHIPGSGSAAAYQGMLASQMVRTVIELTLDPKRIKQYSQHSAKLSLIKIEIDSRICDELQSLFVLDSEQFDDVIRLRNLRDDEKDWKKKREYTIEAQDALLVSTETPLKIATYCIELAKHATFVFDNGFKAARGDSSVALNCAISALAGCLSIVELNLTKAPLKEKTREILKQKLAIKLEFEALAEISRRFLQLLENEASRNISFLESVEKFRQGNLADNVNSLSDIENIARNLQNTLWEQKEEIWKNNKLKSYLEVLDPIVVIKKVMGYTLQNKKLLGNFDSKGIQAYEIAGIIDKKEKLIQISENFSLETRNFTAAHELGHAILHRQNILHRDKPSDGSEMILKNREETEADKFATYFLMPKKWVIDFFLEIFGTTNFKIDGHSALLLNKSTESALRYECKDKRGLARMLSSHNYYAGKKFVPLIKIFKVSKETMAIRLEELNLLEF